MEFDLLDELSVTPTSQHTTQLHIKCIGSSILYTPLITQIQLLAQRAPVCFALHAPLRYLSWVLFAHCFLYVDTSYSSTAFPSTLECLLTRLFLIWTFTPIF